MITKEKTAQKLWNALFDEALEQKYKENDDFSSISMLFHIIQLQFEKVKKKICKLQEENEKQAKTIVNLNEGLTNHPLKCDCNKKNCALELTLNQTDELNREINDEVISIKDSGTESGEVISDPLEFDDMFDQHIREVDLDNLENSIINDSLENLSGCKSPTLNKTKHFLYTKKKKRSNLEPKLKRPKFETSDLADENKNEHFIVCDTPSNSTKRKWLKQSKLTNKQKFKNSQAKCKLENDFTFPRTIMRNEHENNFISKTLDQLSDYKKKSLDDEETFCAISASDKSDNNDEEVDIEEILSDISNRINMCNVEKPVNNTSMLLENSYDHIPKKKSYEKYPQKEVIRKKADRALLQGWDCSGCENYYSKLQGLLTTDEINQRKKMCSRHKSNYNPRAILTPPGYWNPEITVTQESIVFDP